MLPFGHYDLMYVHVLLVIVYMYGVLHVGRGEGKTVVINCTFHSIFHFYSPLNFNFTLHMSHLHKNVATFYRAAQSEGW